MTDKTCCGACGYPVHATKEMACDWCRQSADRIEALTKERDEADDLAKAAFADGASNNIRLAETSYRVKWLEAKLAKAEEVLRDIAAECGCSIARAALAAFEKENGK